MKGSPKPLSIECKCLLEIGTNQVISHLHKFVRFICLNVLHDVMYFLKQIICSGLKHLL